MAELDLRVLLARAKQGDPQALAALYDRYSAGVYRYLYRRTGDPELAEDLAGATFLRMLEAVEGRRAWDQSFSGWLYRIAHNLLTDHLRSRTRHPETELPEVLPTKVGLSLDERVAGSLEASEVRDAVNALKQEYAEVLILRFAEGLSHAEVAALVGRTEGAVKVMQHRALKALRGELTARAVVVEGSNE